MSSFPTRLQIKDHCAKNLPFDTDLDAAIQELQDRIFDAGLALASRIEERVDFSTAITDWNDLPTVHFPDSDFDGLAGVRDNHKPYSVKSWKVVDIEAEHQSPGTHAGQFIDHKIHDISSVKTRIYQVPDLLKASEDTFLFLFKVAAPTIADDDDVVHVRNLYVAKLGLLAIGYENEGDPRADAAYSKFLSHASQSIRRHDGVKRRFVGLDTGIRLKPTNRM